jgi:hypothetical protein
MRRIVGFTLVTLAALAVLAGPVAACEGDHHTADWACVYSLEADVGYCLQNPLPTVDSPPEAEVLPEVPDLAPLVEQYVVPLVSGKRF